MIPKKISQIMKTIKKKKKKKHLIIRKAVINTGCELYNKLHTCNSIRSILNSSEKIW